MSSNSQIALPRFAYAQANSSEALRQLERKWSLGGLGLTSRPDTSIAKRMSIRGLVGRRSNSRIGVSGEELRSSASSVSSSRRKPRAPGIFSGFSQDSTGTLFDDVEESIGDVRASGKQISAKTQKNETWGWRYLIHLSAFFLSVGVFAGIWADILVGQGPIQGAVIAVLTTFSLVVLLQVCSSR
ncbi:hypothetical protein BC830DRAFT_1167949 [Chytriomyces sp. MP71]|nr:hypothetical protein BC830DRAFT_1167949 [Chytriomyces sp. MP71]